MITYKLHPIHEVLDYLQSHEDEHYEDIKDKSLYPEINMNWDIYIELSEAGMCHAVIIYDDNKPVGYSAFTLTTDLNNSKSVIAYSVALFIEKEYRGSLVLDFIKECDNLLAKIEVRKILYNCSDERIGRILRKADYLPKSVNWTKTL